MTTAEVTDRRAELAGALAAVEQRIVAACEAARRPRADVTLVAVTKTRPVSDVALLQELGVRDVGESKDQEAREKATALPDLRWHFVGQVQRNKARSIATYADVVHSVDRPRLVDALSDGALRAGRALDVLLQVSLATDASTPAPDGRGGATAAEVPALADRVAEAEGLRLAGVMAVVPQGADPDAAFARLADCAQALRRDHPQATAVSAGMSGDLEQAIANGATTVRVGTALLGARPPLLR